MSEHERGVKPEDELPSSAEQTISPGSTSWVGDLILGAIVFALGSLALLALLVPILQTGKPATRSERLETERRMAEIERAERELAATMQDDTSTRSEHHAPTSHAGND